MKYYLVLAFLPFLLVSCYQKKEVFHTDIFFPVIPNFETDAVKNADDAADDPSIWVNPEDPSESLLICTNKKSGIVVYNLKGKEVGFYPIGLINNIDVRQGIYLSDSIQIDIAAGSNRTDQSITVMRIRPDGTMEDIAARKIYSEFKEVYGFCLYHDLQSSTLYAVVTSKEGMVEQWKLYVTESMRIDGLLVRTFRAGAGQLEGCVGDDGLGLLYIGEENHGIWRFQAHPDSTARGTLVDDLSNPALKDDIEGMTIYYEQNGKGFLIVSSQGNNSFAVYERETPNFYLGSFVIVDGEQIDGVSETDGIDITAYPMGPDFPLGFFIAQDGHNYQEEQLVNQNFKIVDWQKIARMLKTN
jgi:3-phytase